MSKTLMDKKVNKVAKKLNKTLKEDVFGTRFEIRQYKKMKTPDGLEYYLYQCIDNEQPERNKITCGWHTGFSITEFGILHLEMNDFIVTSDFWAKYRKSE